MAAFIKGASRLFLVTLTTMVLGACTPTMVSQPPPCKDGFCAMTQGQTDCPRCTGKNQSCKMPCCSNMKDMDMHKPEPMAGMNHNDLYGPAMAKMHEDMAMATGDPDVDFMQGMIPHHQGAVDMAEIALTHSKDPHVRKLAKDIIKSQKAEIAFMRDWLSKHEQKQ